MSFYVDPLFVAAEVAWRQESLGRANVAGSPRRGRVHHRHLWMHNRRSAVGRHQGHAARVA